MSEQGKTMASKRYLFLSILAGALCLGAPWPVETASAQTPDKVEQDTSAVRGTNGDQNGYWITVKERIFAWEAQNWIDVVAYYRPYRSHWLSALADSSFREAGGRRDNWWQAVDESKVQSAVETVGYSTLYAYVRDNTTADWQNHGVLFIDVETGKLLGHLDVTNSYDASTKVQNILDKKTDVALNTGTFKVLLSATSVLSSPIILDLEGLGRPDLLAGPVWNVLPGRKLASAALRGFNLDGSGDYAWEWVGPRSALLVWDADGKGNIQSGEQLFGSHTWGKQWKDGYEALATLDDNGDRKLTVTEFANLAIWRDANSNGISEPGEVTSLTESGIESISLQAERDKAGNAWAARGFVRKTPAGERKTLATWDWISMGEARPVEGTYVWVGESGDRKLGGYFKLHRAGSEVRGFTVPTVGVNPLPAGVLAAFPITGKRHGDVIRWSVPAADGTVKSEVTWDSGGKHLYGHTVVDTRTERFDYLWQAELVAGNPIGSKAPAGQAGRLN